VRIYGVSDDLVEVDGVNGADEYSAFGRVTRIEIGDVKSGGLAVELEYRENGCWAATVIPLSDDVAFRWPVSASLGGRGYSAQVEVDCPYDTPYKITQYPCPIRSMSDSDAADVFQRDAVTGAHRDRL